MIDDAELLHRYATEGSQDAFREFVQRHLSLVYSAALRRTGNSHLAEDVAQVVFSDAARKAATLARHGAISGWLYTATRNVAIKMMLSENRRAARETVAEAAKAFAPDPAANWAEIEPVLDSAVDELGDTDREAILLRFFENRTLAQVGATLHLSEDAARMQVGRALDKLREFLARRGVTSTAAALAAIIADRVASETPSGLSGAVSDSALAANSGAVATTGISGVLAAVGGKLGLAAAVAALVAAGIFIAVRHRAAPGASTTDSRAPIAVVAPAARSSPRQGTSAAAAEVVERVPSLAEVLAERDPVRAVALYAQRTAQLDVQGIGAELDELLRHRKPEQKATFVGMLLRRWGGIDPQGGIDAITRLQGGLATGLNDADFLAMKSAVLKGWIVERPAEAWDWAIQSAPDLEWIVAKRLEGTSRIASQARIPVAEREASIRSSLLTTRLREVLPALLEARRFDEAASLVLASPSDSIPLLAQPLVREWASNDPTRAGVWIDQHLSSGAARQGGIVGFAEAVAPENLGLADRFLRSLTDQKEVSAVASAVVSGLGAAGQRDAAFSWLKSASADGDAGSFDAAILTYERLTGWSPESDSRSEHQALLQRVSDPAARRNALGGYIRRAVSRSPIDAFEAARALQPPEEFWRDYRSQNSAGSILTQWTTNDPNAAAAYVSGLVDLTPAQQEIVRASVDLGRRTAGQ